MTLFSWFISEFKTRSSADLEFYWEEVSFQRMFEVALSFRSEKLIILEQYKNLTYSKYSKLQV